MKLIKTAVAAGLLAFVMTASAQNYNLRASVPFKFAVGNQVMPAGDYLVKMDVAHTRIELMNQDGSVQAYIPVMSRRTVGSPVKASLTFNTYGRTHYLHTVKGAGTPEGWDLFRSRAERESAKSIVPTTTEIALVR